MTAKLLDGRAVATEIRSKLKAQIKTLAGSITAPSLVSVVVGANPVSQAYMKNNEAACAQVGIRFRKQSLPAATSQLELERAIGELNADRSVTGILLHLPLPRGLNETAALS